MTNEAPEFFSVALAQEELQVHNQALDAAARLRERASQIERVDDPSAPRIFLSPTHPNGRFLVTAGTVRFGINPFAPMGVQPAAERVGDVWCEFSSGICATTDPEILDWLEAHSGDPADHRTYHDGKDENVQCGNPIGLCREQGPGVDVWAELKAGQQPTSSRPAIISPEIDVDAFMRGDYASGNKSMSKGTGARMAQAAEAAANAARERADGSVN